MKTCRLCEAPPEPGKDLCKYHLLEKQERKAAVLENVWKFVKGPWGGRLLLAGIVIIGGKIFKRH